MFAMSLPRARESAVHSYDRRILCDMIVSVTMSCEHNRPTNHLKTALKQSQHFTLITLITLIVIAALGYGYPCTAQDFLYTHKIGSSRISGYSVSSSGTLTPIPGVDFQTGRFQSPWGIFVSSHSASAVQVGGYLYIANGAGRTVSAFRIDASSGTLTPTSGFTSPADVSMQSCLSASYDGRFLFQGFLEHNIFSPGGHSTINIFRVGADGALEPISDSPYIFPGGLYGLAVSHDGRFLAVGQWFDRSIALYGVDSDGKLTPAPGSPLALDDFGLATNLQFNCEGDSLYVMEPDAGAIGVFAIDPAGKATRASRIPLVGGNPSDLVLTPNGQYLFATDLDANIIHAFKIGANRGVEKVPNSPFTNSGGRQPHGLAINAAGTLLYVANLNDTISVFRIGSDGTLTAAGSPFGLGQGASPAFIAAYPSNGCDVSITSVEIRGKKLFVFGNNFDDGSVILLEGEEQNTKNDPENWTTELIGKKAGKRIKVGLPVSIKVRTAGGRMSQAFRFERTP